MWMQVMSLEGQIQYVNIDRVVKIAFNVNAEAKQVDKAELYVVSGEGVIMVGTVTGDVSLKKLEEYVASDSSGNDFFHA